MCSLTLALLAPAVLVPELLAAALRSSGSAGIDSADSGSEEANVSDAE